MLLGFGAFFLLSTFGLQLKLIKMRISMFIGNPKILKRDKYFILEGKKQCFKMFHSGRKKWFGNNQKVLFMNEIELESPLSTASMWLSRSSERRDLSGNRWLSQLGLEAFRLHIAESKDKFQ